MQYAWKCKKTIKTERERLKKKKMKQTNQNQIKLSVNSRTTTKKKKMYCNVSIQFSSVTHSCPTLCDPMNCSTPGLPVHHQLPEFTQTYTHRVGDAIQQSHPLSSPSPPALNPSPHQDLFKWVSSSREVAKVLEFQLQHEPFQWIPRTDLLLGWAGWISLQSKGLSRVVFNTTVQKHQFFSAQLSL